MMFRSIKKLTNRYWKTIAQYWSMGLGRIYIELGTKHVKYPKLANLLASKLAFLASLVCKKSVILQISPERKGCRMKLNFEGLEMQK